MGTAVFFCAAAGLLTGGAMGAVQRSQGSRRGWLWAFAMAAAAALCLGIALLRMRDL